MDITSLIEILDSEEAELRLYFTRKKGIRYKSYSPIIDTSLQNKLKKLIVEYLNKYVDTEQIDFSPVGYREKTIENCNIEYINSYTDVADSFHENNVNREPIDDEIVNKFNFYCLIVYDRREGRNDRIMFFRRVTKFKKLTSSGIFGQIKGNRFDEIDATLLGIDGNIDLVVHGDDVLILNHIALERIFSLSEQYLEKAQTAINFIRESNRISNFVQFEEDCLNDGRVTRILTKMLTEEDRLERCFENFTNVVNVIEIFELEIDIENSDGIDKIVYNNKDQLMDVIRLVRDSYYKSIINDRPGIDDGI